MLNEIKPLIDLGFSCILLRPESKIPVGKDWQSKPFQTFKELEKQYKDHNVGVKPGKPSKLKDGTYLAILDCDVKTENKAHRAELHKNLDVLFPGWEAAPRVTSGRNKFSMHIYCRTKQPHGRLQLKESAHKVAAHMPSKAATEIDRAALTAEEIKSGQRIARAWEISFYGTGSQAVLPPSIHPDSGRAYAWTKPITSIKDLPKFTVPESKLKDIPLVSASRSEFKFVAWDMMDFIDNKVPDDVVDTIVNGNNMKKYNNDRSSAIYGIINLLLQRGLSEDKVISIMSDEENAISEKALERGEGDRTRAAKWLASQVNKVKNEHDQRDGFDPIVFIKPEELSDEEIEDQEEDIAIHEWMKELQKTDRGFIKNTAFNRDLIFQNELLAGTFAYNEFFQGVFYRQDPPWHREDEPSLVDTEFKGQHLTFARVWLSENFQIDPSEDEIFRHILKYSSSYSFHPVKEYLKGLKWDGISRLENWLITYMGAHKAPKSYLRAVGSKALVAAVARIMRPGYKFDEMLVLEGDQGTGKSTILSVLGGEWYGSPIIEPSNKDTISNMHNLWIIEIGEMVPAHKSDQEALKAFLSMTKDRARLAYERKAETYERQCVFIGTTNKDDYLQDETGNRRYWPVQTGNVDIEAMRRDRDQLWAEAVQFYKDKLPTHLETPELRKIAAEQTRKRYLDDPWTDDIRKFAVTKPDGFTVKEVWQHLQGFDGIELSVGRFTQADQKRIAKTLKACGFMKERHMVDRVRQYFWRKIGN